MKPAKYSDGLPKMNFIQAGLLSVLPGAIHNNGIGYCFSFC